MADLVYARKSSRPAGSRSPTTHPKFNPLGYPPRLTVRFQYSFQVRWADLQSFGEYRQLRSISLPRDLDQTVHLFEGRLEIILDGRALYHGGFDEVRHGGCQG